MFLHRKTWFVYPLFVYFSTFVSEPLPEGILGATSADLCSKGGFVVPLRIFLGPKIRSGSAEGPSRARQDGFRHSLFPYLALHLTSHHPFFMFSHWVSVSAGNPAIAVARKVWVLVAPEIENGSKISSKNSLFFFFFQKSWKSRKAFVFQYFSRFLAYQNVSKIKQKIDAGPPFFSIFFRASIFDPFLSSFGSPLAPFGSPLAPFGSLLIPFGSLLAPFWHPLGPFWRPLAPFGFLFAILGYILVSFAFLFAPLGSIFMFFYSFF